MSGGAEVLTGDGGRLERGFNRQRHRHGLKGEKTVGRRLSALADGGDPWI